jgi:hypothetical protein
VKWIVLGLVLVLLGCSSGLDTLRASWNAANAGAVATLTEIESLHEAETQTVVTDPALSKEQKLAALDAVMDRWAPVYVAFRAYRAVLAASRVALEAAEAAELAGHQPDLTKVTDLGTQAIEAKHALAEAIP